jgi:glycosyltransferase involved in cell wall biosynthesis
MVRHVDCFISPSRFTLKKQAELGLGAPIVHIPYFLPKPTECNGLEVRASESPTARPYFVFVGRLEKIKGVQNLIPIFKARPQYDLIIAGIGEYESTLKDMARGASNIKFVGYQRQDQLQGLYRRAIAVIVPSICYETFGIIIIEAFSMMTPVIVNNLGALPEVIEDSGGGFTYSDEAELVRWMELLAGDSGLRDRLGRNGHEAYLEFWTEEAHLRQYFGLLDSLMRRRDLRAAASNLGLETSQANGA